MLLFKGAGAGAGEKNTRNRSKMDRLRNTVNMVPQHWLQQWNDIPEYGLCDPYPEVLVPGDQLHRVNTQPLGQHLRLHER